VSLGGVGAGSCWGGGGEINEYGFVVKAMDNVMLSTLKDLNVLIKVNFGKKLMLYTLTMLKL
jgi:hypothetical protein